MWITVEASDWNSKRNELDLNSPGSNSVFTLCSMVTPKAKAHKDPIPVLGAETEALISSKNKTVQPLLLPRR